MTTTSFILDRAEELKRIRYVELVNKVYETKAAGSGLEKELRNIEQVLLNELVKIDQKLGNMGMFQFLTVKPINATNNHNVVALLIAGESHRKVAWFKTYVTTGKDMSDASRPTVCVSARIYPPYPVGKDPGAWDTEEKIVEDNGGKTIYAYSMEEMPEFFEKLAEAFIVWV